MKLCVGAASRRVVEEAAKLHVAQIVASRRQVGEFEPGYTGYTSATLVQAVKVLSGGETEVVRDHGGPYQNGEVDDNWLLAFDADMDAGFDTLHLDVSKVTHGMQITELTRLCQRYGDRVNVEVGGERDAQGWLYTLLAAAQKVCEPVAAVAAFGGNIWADRQCGQLVSVDRARAIAQVYGQVAVKAHNFDWAFPRPYDIPGYYNVAPEFGNVEVDAWLHMLPFDQAMTIMDYAYMTGAWQRWFSGEEGTYIDRARAALRYHLETPQVTRIISQYDDHYVRGAIRDAIERG